MAILNGTSTGEALITADGTVGTDYSVTMNTTVLAGGANESSIAVRFVDINNFYFMGIGCWGHEVSIGKIVNGNPQELVGAGAATDVQPGRPYTLKAVVLGNILQLFVDGVKVLEATDSSLPAGAWGIRTYATSIQVTDIFATSPTPNNDNTAAIVLLAVAAALALA